MGVRRLDASEAYFYLMDRVSCMNFVTIVERDSAWPEDQLRRALDLLIEEEPILRVRVALLGEPADLWFVPMSSPSIPLEHIDLDSSDWDARIEGELAQPFRDDSVPLVRCSQLRSVKDGKACLMLTMHHCISDGRGAACLVKRLVDSMAGGGKAPVERERRIEGLPVGMHAAFPQRFRWKDDPGAARRMSSALLRDAAAGGMLTDLPWLRGHRADVKRPRLIRLWLSEEQTLKLAGVAKRRGVSVHGVLCAAQLIAEAQLLAGEGPASLLLTCPVDMRHQVEGLVEPSPMQLYASMLFATYKVCGSASVWGLAAEVMARTREQLERGDAHYFYSSREVSKALASPSTEAGLGDALEAVPAGSVMSAVGRMPTIESDPLVTSVSFAICSGSRHVIFSAASSYRGRMVINVAFDEARLVAGVGEALAEQMKSVLVNACEDREEKAE